MILWVEQEMQEYLSNCNVNKINFCFYPQKHVSVNGNPNEYNNIMISDLQCFLQIMLLNVIIKLCFTCNTITRQPEGSQWPSGWMLTPQGVYISIYTVPSLFIVWYAFHCLRIWCHSACNLRTYCGHGKQFTSCRQRSSRLHVNICLNNDLAPYDYFSQ